MVSARARLLCACFSCFFSRFLVLFPCRSVVARWPPRPFRGLWGVSWLLLLSAVCPLSLLPVPRLRRCRLCVLPAPVSRPGRPTAPVCPSALPRGPSRGLWLWFALPPRRRLSPSPGLGAIGSKWARALASVPCAAGVVPGLSRCLCRPPRPRRVAALSARVLRLPCPALAFGVSSVRAGCRLLWRPALAGRLPAPGVAGGGRCVRRRSRGRGGLRWWR